MIIKTIDAGKKICPMMTAGRAQSKWIFCQGPICMLWQHFESFEFKNKADAEFKRSNKRLETDEGFCGLTKHGEK